MATRFTTKALSIAALGIVLCPLLAATTTRSPAWENTGGALQLEPPAEPSNCKATLFRDRREGDYTVVSWKDNSTNEDGFTLEVWWRNQSGTWVLAWSVNEPANSTAVYFGGRAGPRFKFRVKAFNASGDSAWSNWGH